MHILSVKKICLCYVYYQTIEIIFKINIVICYSWLFPVPYFLLIFLASFWKAKTGLRMSLRKEKWLIIILKDLIKQPVIKQIPTFLSFSFLIDCCISVFSLSLSKRLQILKNW